MPDLTLSYRSPKGHRLRIKGPAVPVVMAVLLAVARHQIHAAIGVCQSLLS